MGYASYAGFNVICQFDLSLLCMTQPCMMILHLFKQAHCMCIRCLKQMEKTLWLSIVVLPLTGL